MEGPRTFNPILPHSVVATDGADGRFREISEDFGTRWRGSRDLPSRQG
jgi:hypothetical protein